MSEPRSRRRQRRSAAALALTTVLALAAPSASPAQQPPLGSDDGIEIRQQGRRAGGLVVRFTPRAAGLYGRIAGKQVEVDCARLRVVRGGFDETGSSSASFRAPRRGRRLVTGITGRFDWCAVIRPARRLSERTGPGQVETKRLPARELVAVPLTALGANFLDERATARAIIATVTGAGELAGEGPFPPADLLAQRLRAVPLAAPDQPPPPDQVGIYSDGGQLLHVAKLTTAGKLLFFELSGDAVRTNIFGFLDEDA